MMANPFYQPYAPPVFDASDACWKAFLGQHGYVVIQVLDDDAAKLVFESMWAWILERFPNVRRDDPSSYTFENWPDHIHGILKSYGAGHADFVWDLRVTPTILDVFAEIHGVDAKDLITSFDGFCFYPKGLPVQPNQLWAHRDQNPNSNAWMCYQGLVSLTPPSENAGGLVLWDSTLHTDFSGLHDTKDVKGNWYKIPKDHDLGVGKLMRVPRGALVLWDSRIVHQNTPGLTKDFPDRACVYLCMQPRSSATKATLEKRVKYYLAGRTTSHWPGKVKVNSEAVMFRSRYKTDPKRVMAEHYRVYKPESETVRRLVGFGTK